LAASSRPRAQNQARIVSTPSSAWQDAGR
jgi:hypothetical protein